MNTSRTKLCLGLLAAGVWSLSSAPSLEGQQLEPPYSVEELRIMITSPMTESRVAQLVTEGCLDFVLDAFIIADLREAGASLDLIGTLNEACVEVPEASLVEPEEDEPVVVTAPEEVVEAPSRRTRRYGGFYGPGSWLRLQYGKIGETESGAISWANNASGAVEFGLSGGGSRLATNVGGFDTNLWNADTSLWLNLFLLQPSRDVPVGLYIGGLAGFNRAWVSDGFGEGQNRYRYGWESGLYGAIGNTDIVLIPRVAYQSTRIRVASTGMDIEPIPVKRVIMGAEILVSGIAPGVFVDISDGETLTIFALTFTF